MQALRMASASHNVSTVEEYQAKKKELLAGPAPHLILFSSDLDATGLPWCPDCVRSLPAVAAAVARAGGSLLEVRVGPRAAWKSREHPFRSDPILKLTGIPTLLRVDAASGNELARVGPELEAAGTQEEAANVVERFLTAQS